jgi:glycine betaine/proline transport system permease protein
MQTIPAFVYLIPGIMLFGLGAVPAIIATFIYAVPPLVRLTDLGIRLVDKEVIEAADAFGASRKQKLLGVQLPLALAKYYARDKPMHYDGFINGGNCINDWY